jgi:hypothetical protein
MNLTFSQIKENLAVCRFPINHIIPIQWIESAFFSITRTTDELSGILNLENIKVSKTWKGLKIEGPLDFSLIGIMANIATTLANGGVSIFAISTYDTDYILVKEKDFERTKELLINAGHSVI